MCLFVNTFFLGHSVLHMWPVLHRHHGGGLQSLPQVLLQVAAEETRCCCLGDLLQEGHAQLPTGCCLFIYYHEPLGDLCASREPLLPAYKIRIRSLKSFLVVKFCCSVSVLSACWGKGSLEVLVTVKLMILCNKQVLFFFFVFFFILA